MNYTYLHFNEIDSTNNYLKNSYKLLNDFTFVSADFQTSGKGREDRVWTSEKGLNLMFSVLIKDNKLMDEIASLSIITACEVAKLLEEKGLKKVSVKWPNDVLVNDEKICGILLQGQVPEYLVVGVGLNVNQKQFPSDLRRPATSMSLELKNDADIEEIKNILFSNIFKSFKHLDKNCYFNYLKTHNYLLHKKVRAMINQQVFIGEVMGIDENYNLQIMCNDMLLHIDSGEIEIL